MASTYQIEPHAPYFDRRREGYDLVIAENDLDALRQARALCPAGDVYRIANASGIYNHLGGRITLVYVARFFRWEHR